MKTKLLIFMVTVLVAILLLGSCDLSFLSGGQPEEEQGGEGEENKPPSEPENLIYNATSELFVILDPSVTSQYVNTFVEGLSHKRTELVDYAAVNSDPHKHEIVIGNTDRAISKTALDKLARVEKNSDEDFTFVIYSDGSSLAVVWEEDGYGAMQNAALKYLCENYIADELIKRSGADTQTINIIDDYFRVNDSKNEETRWANFESRYGEELTASLRQLYAIYSADCITWLANLYDPDICVCQDLYGEEECSNTKYCGTGGFYFSNSARDTLGYLPDVESTHQALNFLTSAGLDGNYLNIISEDMKKQIGDFVYALEEPNGYFYHPQWGIAFTDTKITRRSRDLSWATGILSVLGRTPKYTTASGIKGEDVLGSSGKLTERLGSSVSAVSKVIATADDAYASHLQDEASFRAYLDSKDIRNNSYGVGSEIGSQTSQIKARDKQIGTPDNPTPLMSMLIEWLNENQNPETGNWDWKKPGDEGYIDYHGTNGLLKIGGIYTEHGVEMPYAREAALSAMADIMNPAEVNQVVDLYNTWFGIKNILNNLRECGGSTGPARAEEIRLELLAIAPEAIIVSRDKIAPFLKPDGSASYGLHYSSSTAQGCPSAVPGTIEGDVNGSTIAINGIIGNITAALSISKPNLFGSTEKYLFMKEINGLSPITKVDSASVPEYLTFDYEDVGVPSEELTILEGNGGTANVIADPTDRSKGNVLEVVSHKKAGDTIKIPVQNVSGLANSYVFEGDFYISEATSDYLLQLTIDACYMITFRQVTDENDPDYGRIRMVESSSATGDVSIDRYLGVTVDKGQWFKIKMEYYLGDESTVRIKFYADTDLSDGENYKLYAVSDNYRNESGVKVTTGTGTPTKAFYISQIYVMSSASLKMYADNLNCYVSREAYSEVLGEGDDPYFNIDTPDRPEIKYDFEGEELEESIKVSSPDSSVSLTEGGMLSILGSQNASSVTVPLNVRTKMAKCAVTEFDILVNDAQIGKEVLLLEGMDGKEKIFGMVLVAKEENGEKYLALCPKANETDTAIEGANILLGESATVRLEYYHLEDVILVYINDVFLGASTKLYDHGIRREMDSFRISTFKGVSVDAAIDDVTVEMTAGLFVDAVAPDVPEKLYDFENQDSTLKLEGKSTSVQKFDGDKAVLMNSSVAAGSLTIPINVRATVTNSLSLSVTLNYTVLPTEGDMHRISIFDTEGNEILAYVVSRTDSGIALYEVGVGGRLSYPLYTFSEQEDEGIVLSLIVYNDSEVVHLLNGKKVIAKSSVFVGQEYLGATYGSLKISSLSAKSTLAIDDLKCEELYQIYKTVTLTSTDNPETDLSTGLTFESSSSGNLPSLIYSSLFGDNGFFVKNVFNETSGEYSNVLVHSKPGSGNDEFSFRSDLDTTVASAVVFESDIKLDVSSNGYAYRIYFGTDKRGSDPMYIIQINKTSSGDVYIDDVSSASDNPLKNSFRVGVKAGNWFKLRVEMYKGTRDTVKFKVFVNDTLIGESDNFAGKHNATAEVKPLPKTVFFYSMGATRGEVYFDNVKLYTIN